MATQHDTDAFKVMQEDVAALKRQVACAVSSCNLPSRKTGWCQAHYLRWHRHGDLRSNVPIRSPEVCPSGHDAAEVGRTRDGRCKLCHQARSGESRRRRKLAVVTQLGGACIDCGFNFISPLRLECADFDHIEGRDGDLTGKSMHILSSARFHEEVEKCDLVCANCHRTRTQARLRDQNPALQEYLEETYG